MFCIKNCFFGAGQSRALKGGAGVEIFYLEPEPKKQISGAGAEAKWLGSATLHKVPGIIEIRNTYVNINLNNDAIRFEKVKNVFST